MNKNNSEFFTVITKKFINPNYAKVNMAVGAQ